MTRVIMLNAPPMSGKDTAADYLPSMLEHTEHICLKDGLFDEIVKHYNIDYNTFFSLYADRSTKELPSKLLDGLSPRAVMCYVSENICKAQNGRDYFALRLCKKICSQAAIVVSDCGFAEEVATIIAAVEPENVLLIRIERAGCTFNGDSRNWVYGMACDSITLDNNDTVDDFREHLMSTVTSHFPELKSLEL